MQDTFKVISVNRNMMDFQSICAMTKTPENAVYVIAKTLVSEIWFP